MLKQKNKNGKIEFKYVAKKPTALTQEEIDAVIEEVDKSKDYSSFKNVDITYVEESIIKKFFPEEISNLNEINLKTLYEEKKKIELNVHYN